MPATFELEGKSGGITVVKYGFVIKKWFINRGLINASVAKHTAWCEAVGYATPSVADLTNASGQGSTGATPSSGVNFYMRHIGSGLFTEWGDMSSYTGVGFRFNSYWTSDTTGTKQFYVDSYSGAVFSTDPAYKTFGVCTQP